VITRTGRGTVLRRLRKVVPLDGWLPDGRSARPDDVYLVPTLRCNLACPYCFQRNADGVAWFPAHPDDLSLDAWRAVVDELRPMGPSVYVIGGELFLYRGAMDLLRSVKAAGLPLSIITNGTALPAVADELVAMGLDGLVVSIDGPPEVHNTLRGHPRGYELATEGIHKVLAGRADRRHPSVQVFTAITPATQGHLPAFARAMGELGVDRVVLNHLIYATPEQAAAQAEVLEAVFGVERPTANALANGFEDAIDVAALRRSMAEIRAGPWSDRVVVSPAGVEANVEGYYAPGAPAFRGQCCRAVNREMWIMPNGDVSACVHIGELVMGNVRDGGLRAAWNSPAYRRFRRHLGEEGLLPACARCEKLTYHHPPR